MTGATMQAPAAQPARDDAPRPGGGCVVLRAGDRVPYTGKNDLQYFEGVSTQRVGSQGLCMHLLTVPPGGRSKAHLHEAHETAVYVLSGEGYMLCGPQLEARMTFGPGDFVYIPAGAPHVVFNTGNEAMVGVLARTDPNEQESVVLRPDLEAAVR